MSKSNNVGSLSHSTTVVTRFLFLCAVLLAIPAVTTAQGSVTLQPDQGPVGTGVTATGTGWPAGELVHAFFDQLHNGAFAAPVCRGSTSAAITEGHVDFFFTFLQG
jgi:hypothetical protein